MEVDRVNIRNYRSEDRKIVREISLQSSILGEYRDTIFDDKILTDLLTLYFTDFESQSCFVAEKDNRVIGYVMGTQDFQKMRSVINGKILPVLLKNILYRGLLFRHNNLKLIMNMLYSYFKGEFKVPDFSQNYPATLHVNITTEYRGHHSGSLLVNKFLEHLKENNVRGIHFGVLSESAKRFFLKLDFEILFTGQYTFLRYLTGETLPHYIMGKKL